MVAHQIHHGNRLNYHTVETLQCTLRSHSGTTLQNKRFPHTLTPIHLNCHRSLHDHHTLGSLRYIFLILDIEIQCTLYCCGKNVSIVKISTYFSKEIILKLYQYTGRQVITRVYKLYDLH